MITDHMLGVASEGIASATHVTCGSLPHDAIEYGISLEVGAWCCCLEH